MKPSNETRTALLRSSNGSRTNGGVATAISDVLESRATEALALLVAILCLLFFTVALLGASTAGAMPAEAAAEPAIDAEASASLFAERKCALCHGAAAAGIEATTKSDKLKGPDLSGYSHEDPVKLRAYLQDGAELDGKKHRRKSKISEQDLGTLLAWLASLEPGEAPEER